jgi:site-specific recombinase XerD
MWWWVKLNKKLQVFVSSTYIDLKNERQKAVEGILRSKHIPAGMELFIPSDKTQWEIIKEWIRDSDLLLLILGGRYGSIEPESGKSYTHLEYEFALSNGIPVFTIVLNDQFLANKKSRNIEINVYEHEVPNPSLEKYKDFKKLVTSNLVSIVEDINQISTEVSLALQEFLRKDELDYHFRGWVRGKEKPNSIEMSIDYNIKKYIEDKDRQGLAKITLDSYMRQLCIFQDYLKDKLINDIDTECIKDFLNYREQNYSVNSKSSMEVVRSILKVFFDWLVQEKIIDSNPVNRIQPYKYIIKGNEGLNNTELQKLRDACSTPRERAILEISLSTGCKLSELLEMQINQIDWENKTIHINSRVRNRIVFMTPNAEKYVLKYLKTRQDKVNYLFITERRPFRKMGARNVGREINNIAARANVSRRVSPKTFRETFASVLMEKGIPFNIIQALLGYTTSSSETYFKITNRNIWDVLKTRPDF